jgi:sugar phosphate isomerase/epimerase
MPPTRRTFLGLGGAAAAAALAARAGAMPGVGALPPGVQLWTVKVELAQDFDGTLRRLRQIGFRRIEAAGWADRTPAAFGQAVTAAGLEPFSCHFSMRDLLDEHESKLAQARDVGARYFVASSPAWTRPIDPAKPWITAVADAMTLDDWRRNADAMNRVGARARAMGMRFGYHNHPMEFLTLDGTFVWDELIRLTDPAAVCFELDLAWVAGAGYDPAQMLTRYAERVELLHVKDVRARERVPGRINGDFQTLPVGAGTIDWRATFRAAERGRVAGWFVEQEPPFAESPFIGLAQSLSYLRELGA